jgi:hypothetical protein
VPEEEATKVSLPFFFFERVACLIQNFMLVCMVVAAILTSLLSLPFFIYLDSAPQLFFFSETRRRVAYHCISRRKKESYIDPNTLTHPSTPSLFSKA